MGRFVKAFPTLSRAAAARNGVRGWTASLFLVALSLHATAPYRLRYASRPRAWVSSGGRTRPLPSPSIPTPPKVSGTH